MKVNKRHLGMVVELLIWDHTTKDNLNFAVKCRVIGRVVKADKINCSLEYWNCEINPELNNEKHNILQSTILDVVTYETIKPRVK